MAFSAITQGPPHGPPQPGEGIPGQVPNPGRDPVPDQPMDPVPDQPIDPAPDRPIDPDPGRPIDPNPERPDEPLRVLGDLPDLGEAHAGIPGSA